MNDFYVSNLDVMNLYKFVVFNLTLKYLQCQVTKLAWCPHPTCVTAPSGSYGWAGSTRHSPNAQKHGRQ